MNAPHLVATNHDVVSINGAISVDLYGQVVADRIHGRQYSGIGGHEDFVAVSGLQLEDRSLVCLPATAARATRSCPASSRAPGGRDHHEPRVTRSTS